jgi:hypothetical protein
MDIIHSLVFNRVFIAIFGGYAAMFIVFQTFCALLDWRFGQRTQVDHILLFGAIEGPIVMIWNLLIIAIAVIAEIAWIALLFGSVVVGVIFLIFAPDLLLLPMRICRLTIGTSL